MSSFSSIVTLNSTYLLTHRFNLGGGSQIFDRIGTVERNKGTSITFQNLSYDISVSDIRQLCATVGEVNDVKFEDKSTSVVWFARRSDAESAVNKFSDLTLDGRPLSVTMTNGQSFNKPNVKLGLFGTANQGGRSKGGSTTFSVNLGVGGGRSVKKPIVKKKPFRPAKPATGESLDAQLDSYKLGKKGPKGKKASKATPEEVNFCIPPQETPSISSHEYSNVIKS